MTMSGKGALHDLLLFLGIVYRCLRQHAVGQPGALSWSHPENRGYFPSKSAIL